MHIVASLAVAESKRLIARGIVQMDSVQRALEGGWIAVGSGTTNGYIIEELTGEPFDKLSHVTGRTVPSDYNGPAITYAGADLVLHRGERVEMKALEALEKMGPGDVFMKGANALNYERCQAGVLIGHPTGGNVGAVIGAAVARRIRFIHPVGLEKSLSVDLDAVAAAMNEDAEGKGPTLWVVPGVIFTEIEALELLADVDVLPCGAGGIGGAEGAVWLTVFGKPPALEQAGSILASLRGEPPFAG
jgi:hypothetical protein